MNKVERTHIELERCGLKQWVSDLLYWRKNGMIEKYNAGKKLIDDRIERMQLDSNKVYMCYGNPDDPKEKELVYDRAEILELKTL